MKKISKDIKVKVQEATEKILQDKHDVDVYSIKEVLERDYKVKFFNDSVLQVLVKESLDNIVYICI